MIRDLIDESLRMRRYPGITFVEGPTGLRARLVGSGLDVWEVVQLLQEYDSVSDLRAAFPRLTPMAIQIAEAYAKEYPGEIQAFLDANAQLPDELRRRVPWLEVVSP